MHLYRNVRHICHIYDSLLVCMGVVLRGYCIHYEFFWLEELSRVAAFLAIGLKMLMSISLLSLVSVFFSFSSAVVSIAC